MKSYFKFFMPIPVFMMILTFMMSNASAATLTYSYENEGENDKDHDMYYVYDPSSGIDGLVSGKAPLGTTLVFRIGDIIDSDADLKLACDASGGEYTFLYGCVGNDESVSGKVSDNKTVTCTIPDDVSLIGRAIYANFSIDYDRSRPGSEEEFTDYYYLLFAADDELVIAGNIEKANISGITGETYTGDFITQDPTIELGGKTLRKGADYELEYANNINVGTATVTITGEDRYIGSLSYNFKISAKSINPAVTLSNTSYTYDGKEKKPTVTVKDGTSTLTEGVDYTVSYPSGRINKGIYKVEVVLKGNYSGSGFGTFEIKEAAPQNSSESKASSTDATAGSASQTQNTVTSANGIYKLSGSAAVLDRPKNRNIKKLTIPASVKIDGKSVPVTTIAANAFKGCTKLTTLTIGKNVTSIGANAFSGCKAFTKVSIGAGVKTIGKNAFLNCVKLKTVSGGKGLTTIGASAFSGCKALTKITLYGKVKKIGAKAFYKCSKLKTITVKTSKLTSKTVGANAFKGIYAKATIKVPKAKLKAYTTLLKKKGIGKNVKVKK